MSYLSVLCLCLDTWYLAHIANSGFKLLIHSYFNIAGSVRYLFWLHLLMSRIHRSFTFPHHLCTQNFNNPISPMPVSSPFPDSSVLNPPLLCWGPVDSQFLPTLDLFFLFHQAVLTWSPMAEYPILYYNAVHRLVTATGYRKSSKESKDSEKVLPYSHTVLPSHKKINIR